jgi:regulator of RNase E activity RraA
LTTQQRIALTREWKGERFPDGRPKAPDSVLEGLKDVDAEEAYQTLVGHGYKTQFTDGWQEINPGGRMVGRVFTAVFMPFRPDVNDVINDQGKPEERSGSRNAWPIEMLSPGDVLVVDLFGVAQDGAYPGNQICTAIFAKSHNGLVVNGALRSDSRLAEIRGMHIFARGFDPSRFSNTMLMGINVPIRMGEVTVLPGDLAVSDPEGITFIPPQFAREIIDNAAFTHQIDAWGHRMLQLGKYTSGQVDGAWTRQMIQEFNSWQEQNGQEMRLPEK